MSDEPIKVKKVEIEGKKYLLDKRTNILYDRESQEPIGVLKDDKVELYDDEKEEKQEVEDKVEFSATLGSFPDWKKLGFTKVPEKYWDIDTWDNQADLLDYEDKKRFIFASKVMNVDKRYDDIQYQLLVKKDGKVLEPVGVVVIDNGDNEILLFLPNEEFYMFLQYFGRGDIVDNLLATGFIETDDDEEEEEEEEEEEVDVNLEKRKEMEDVIRQIGELYTRLKQEYQDNKTEEKLKEAQKAKKILQKKKQEYLDFINSLDNEATRTQPTRVRFGTGIDNPELYEKAKQIADEKYKKPSAYKSGFIIKKYKELGGTYSGEKPKKTGIARWFKEEWKDVGNKEYPVYRPTKRITKETPLTPDEIKPSNLKKQIALKQEIKGDANLPPFEEKTGGKVVALGVQAEKIPKGDDIWKWSNPVKVAEMARKYLGDMAVVFRSTKPKKKYMIFDPDNKKWVFFGEMGYEDFTKHQDPKRRENYLTRTASMKGNWKNNRYSANNLSRNILW